MKQIFLLVNLRLPNFFFRFYPWFPKNFLLSASQCAHILLSGLNWTVQSATSRACFAGWGWLRVGLFTRDLSFQPKTRNATCAKFSTTASVYSFLVNRLGEFFFRLISRSYQSLNVIISNLLDLNMLILSRVDNFSLILTKVFECCND